MKILLDVPNLEDFKIFIQYLKANAWTNPMRPANPNLIYDYFNMIDRAISEADTIKGQMDSMHYELKEMLDSIKPTATSEPTPKSFKLPATYDDVEALHDLINGKPGITISGDFDKHLISIIADHRKREHKLRDVRRANILYYVDKMLMNTGTMTVFTDADKIQLANDIIKTHHIYVKHCRGEV